MSAALKMVPQLVLEVVRASASEPMRVGERKGPARLKLVTAGAEARTDKRAEEGRATGAEVLPAAAGRQGRLEFYRKYTEGMLRRYAKMSMESGRVPSLLGQEMFRGKVTSYRVRSFDDVVIFVHDVEQCLKGLTAVQGELVRRIAVQEYTQAETAAMLGVSLRTVIRKYNGALDELTRVFLAKGMLEPLAECKI